MTDRWRAIRAFRADPPGEAQADPDRADLFRASLEQCQQFMHAAAAVGMATRAVQLFYAMETAGKAIAAVSDGVTLADINSAKSHGLTTNRTPSTLAASTLTRTGKKMDEFTLLTQALGADAFPSDVAITVEQLWTMIFETHEAPLSSFISTPGLVFEMDVNNGKVTHGWLELVPAEVREQCRGDRDKLKAFWSQYPALRGLEFPAAADVAWEPSQLINGRWRAHLRLNHQPGGQQPDLLTGDIVSPHLDPEWLSATPRIGTMAEQPHPMLAWWAVLLMLSSMTRYEPVKWASMTNIDASPEANAIEHLLTVAQDLIPYMIEKQLHRFAQPLGLRSAAILTPAQSHRHASIRALP